MTPNIITQNVTIEAVSDDLSLGKIAAALESVGIHPCDIVITSLRRGCTSAHEPCHSEAEDLS